MKSVNLIITIAICIATIRCSEIREKTAEELLDNPKMEQEIYSAILASKVHSKKFLDRMMNDEGCRAIMMKDTGMLKMMCNSDKLDSLMIHNVDMMESMTNNLMNIIEQDSVICDKTCTRMMESDRFRMRLMRHMKKDRIK